MSAGVAEGLAATAAAFEPAVRPPVDGLLFGPLVERAQGEPAPELELAVELIYEGYLTHYRTSRVVPRSAGTQVLLLAGDYFYAHGLRSLAGQGDTGAVSLLTRLMGACAVLRVEGLPPAVDDRLWEIAVTGVAAGEGTPARKAAEATFRAVETACRRQDAHAIASAVEDGSRTVRRAVVELTARRSGAEGD